MAYEGPTPAVEEVAKQGLTDPAFRRDGSKVDGFEAALAAHYNGPPLTPDEIRYCQGWIELARLQFHGTEEQFDLFLVAAIQATLLEKSATRSG